MSTKCKKSEQKRPTVKSIMHCLSDNLKMIVSIGASIAAICAALAVGFQWFSTQVTASVSSKIDDLSAQVEASSRKADSNDEGLRLSITRLELLSLIRHNPYNVAEIEKVARYYFCELNGDWYMSGVYSEWADEYGEDMSIIVECNND